MVFIAENKSMGLLVKNRNVNKVSLLFLGLLFLSGLVGVFAQVEQKNEKEAAAPLQKAVILCLHDVGGKGKYAVSHKEFVEILDLLKKYRVLSLQKWLEGSRGTSGGKSVVVLTFDDGYPSMFKVVIPRLLEYNYGATFYLYLERYADHSSVYKRLQTLEPQFEIGSHSSSHVAMDTLRKKDLSRFYKELFLSRKKLEYLIQRPVYSWAWPYGRYSEELLRFVDMAGYKTQVSTDYRIADTGQEVFSRFAVQKPNPVEQVKEILKKNFLN